MAVLLALWVVGFFIICKAAHINSRRSDPASCTGCFGQWPQAPISTCYASGQGLQRLRPRRPASKAYYPSLVKNFLITYRREAPVKNQASSPLAGEGRERRKTTPLPWLLRFSPFFYIDLATRMGRNTGARSAKI